MQIFIFAHRLDGWDGSLLVPKGQKWVKRKMKIQDAISGNERRWVPSGKGYTRIETEREGEYARSWRTGSEAVNRLHREPTPQGGADDPPRGRTITRTPKVRAQDTHKQQKKQTNNKNFPQKIK